MALWESAAWLGAEGGDELARMLLRLRLWAGITSMNWVAAPRQAIAVGEPLAVDSERVLGPGLPRHPGLAGQLRQRPQAVSGPD